MDIKIQEYSGVCFCLLYTSLGFGAVLDAGNSEVLNASLREQFVCVWQLIVKVDDTSRPLRSWTTEP